MVTLVYVHMAPDELDQFRFLENCPPTPSLTQSFAPSETQMLMLTLSWGKGRWAVSHKPKLIRRIFDRLKNLTGHHVHTGPFNICALFPWNFEWPGV